VVSHPFHDVAVNGWGTEELRLVEENNGENGSESFDSLPFDFAPENPVIGLVGSHPFHDEAVKWMGHPRFVLGLGKAKPGVDTVEVSHPIDKDKGVARVGHPGERLPVLTI